VTLVVLEVAVVHLVQVESVREHKHKDVAKDCSVEKKERLVILESVGGDKKAKDERERVGKAHQNLLPGSGVGIVDVDNNHLAIRSLRLASQLLWLLLFVAKDARLPCLDYL
jgi:hypothetical protein